MPQRTVYSDFPDGVGARPSRRSDLASEPYYSAEFAAREWRDVWSRCWLFAGLEADLGKPGDYFVFEIGRESIVVLRDDLGDIAAYYNVCQHRGNRIFADHRGCARAISCPYHGWTYRLNGELAYVPDRERFTQGIDSEERSLKPVRVACWAGMVWVNMNPDASPLEDYLGSIVDQLAPYRFENMHVARQQTVSLGANWKTVRDNFLEQYHVDYLHPQHAMMLDCSNSTNELWPYGHSRTQVEGFVTNPRYPIPDEPPDFLSNSLRWLGVDPADFSGRVGDIRAAVAPRKREVGRMLGYDYSALSDEQLTDTWQYDIFPNVFFTVRSEELWIFGPRPHPTDPNQCWLDKWTLQIPLDVAVDKQHKLALGIDASVGRVTGSDRPEREVFTREDVVAGRKSMTITIDQDIRSLNDMQAGLRSRGFERAILNEDEVRVQHFHDWLEVWLAGEGF